MLLRMYLKDIKVLFSDWKAFAGFVFMPMVLTTILSFALSGSFAEPGKMTAISIGVVKAYDAEAEWAEFETQMPGMKEKMDVEAMFFETFLEDEALKKALNAKIVTEQEAIDKIQSEEIVAYVVLPEGFVRDQLVNFATPMRNNLEFQVVSHPDYNYSGQIVTSIFESYFEVLNGKIIDKNVYLEVASGVLPPEVLFKEMGSIVSQEKSDRTFVTARSIQGKRHVGSFTYYAIAMMAMFILYTSGYLGRELLREKRLKTLDRNSVSGQGYIMVMVSKALMAITLCVIQMGTLFGYSKWMLGVDWLEPIKVVVGILFSSIAVCGLGMFISSISLTSENFRVANIFENVIIHIFALFGGSYIPIEVLPEIFKTIKLFALNGIVIDLFMNVYQGVSWVNLSSYFVRLSIIGIVFGILAIVMVKRKEVMNYVGSLKA